MCNVVQTKMKVYKYRSGDKETFKRDLDSLEENCFYASNFKKLNDPCETMVFSDKFNQQTGLFSKFLGANSKRELENVKNALTSLIDKRNDIGIYSLSKTYKDELLWAHYANSHFGFCIEYDLDILIDTYEIDKIYSLPVSYSNTPPQIGLSDVSKSKNDPLTIIKKIACNKSKRWESEEEHRLIIDRAGEQAYNFNAVKSIYFGLRMEEENKDAIMNRLQGRGINYYQMVQANKSYNFYAKPVNDINNTRQTYLQEIPSNITGSSSITYLIVEKDYSWVNGKATIEILLESKINKTSLEWIAKLIRRHVFKKAERIFMSYKIKGKENNVGCWATSHFLNGEIEISINDFYLNEKANI